MNTTLKSLLAFATFASSILWVQAETAPKVAIIDMAKAFDGYYKTAEASAKLKTFQEKVNGEIENAGKAGNAKVEQYKEAVDQVKNPVLTPEARALAEKEAMKLGEEVQKLQQEFNQLTQNINRNIQTNIQNSRQLLVEEIVKVAADLTKKKGYTIVLDKAAMIYFDSSYEVTDELIVELNKNQPAGSPAAAAPAASGDAPSIKFGTK